MALAGTLTVTTGPAYADPTPATAPDTSDKRAEGDPFSSVPADAKARMLAQQPYSRAAKTIQLGIVSSARATGFAGIGISDRSVQLWWKGAIPADVQRVIDKVRRDVRVEIGTARYSRAELKKEAARLGAAMKADPASSLHTIQIPVDGSRVIAVFDRGSGIAAKVRPGATVKTSGKATARQMEIKATGIPVEAIEDARLRTAHRWNDGESTGIFSGGAAIINADNGARCTSAFGVTNGSQRFLLTAGHCGRQGGAWRNGNSTRTIGTASAEHVAHDLLLIPATVDYFIWDGGANSNMFVKSTTGWDWARSGESVCFSGTTSGAQCGITNSSNFTYQYCDTDAYGNRECYNDLIYATRSGTVCRDGDSGAPVFTLNGSSSVWAKGILSGCGTNHMAYQDFGTAWRDFNIRPVG